MTFLAILFIIAACMMLPGMLFMGRGRDDVHVNVNQASPPDFDWDSNQDSGHF